MECLVGCYTALDDDIDYSLDSFKKAVMNYKPPRRVIKLGSNCLTAIDINSKGSLIYVGNDIGEIYSYNKFTHEQKVIQSRSNSHITDLLYIDDNRLLTSNKKGVADLWHATSLQWIQTLQRSPDSINLLQISPDSKSLILVTSNLTLYDLTTLELHTSIPFHTPITSLSVSSEMNYCIILGQDGVLYKYCLHEKKITSTSSSSVQPILHVFVYKHSREFLTFDYEGYITVWDVDSFKKLRVIGSSTEKGKDIHIPECEWWAFTTYKDRTMKVWCLGNESWEMTIEFNSTVEKVKYDKGQEILCCKENGELEFIGLQVADDECESVEIHSDWIECTVCSHDNKTSFTACRNGKVFQHMFPCFDTVQEFRHDYPVTSIALSLDDKFLFCSCVSPSGIATIYIWSLATNSLADILPNISSSSSNLCITSCTQYLITKSSNQILYYNLITKLIDHTIATSTLLEGAFILTPDDTYLMAANSNYQILIFDSITRKEAGVLEGHSDTVNTIVVNKEHCSCFSAGDDGNVIAWSIRCEKLSHICSFAGFKVKSLALSEDERFLFVGFYEKMVYIMSIEERTVIKKILFRSDHYFTTMNLCSSDTYILFTSYKRLFHTLNPLRTDKLTTNKKKFSVFYVNYLKNLYLNSKTPYNKLFNNYRVFPYNTNALHVLASTSNIKSTKQALRDRIPFTKTKNYETAISICLQKNNKPCADAIVKRLPKYEDELKYKLGCILEDYIIELTKANLPSISKLFDLIFIQVDDLSLDKFGYMISKSPILHESFDPYIDKSRFLLPNIKKHQLSNEESLIFQQSYLRFNLSLGSSKSIELIKSLKYCENTEVFRTSLVQAILLYKWQQVSKISYIMTSIYSTYMLILVLYTCHITDELASVCLFLILNTLLSIWEGMQIVSDVKDYFSDLWNLLDFARILSLFVYCMIVFSLEYSESKKYLLSVVIILSWTRYISVFRMFSSTRYLIRIIIEVIKDITPFMLILSTGTFSIGLLFYVIDSDGSDLISCILHSYRLAYGDYDVQNYTSYHWVIFILATVINPLIMMNLLISIMGDTYSRVQDLQLVADGRELGSMILEIESIMFWRRNNGQKMFLQQCSVSEDTVLNGNQVMQGRIRQLKNALKGLIGKQKEEEKRIESFIDKYSRNTDAIDKKIKDLNLLVHTVKTEINTLKVEVDSIRKEVFKLPERFVQIVMEEMNK